MATMQTFTNLTRMGRIRPSRILFRKRALAIPNLKLALGFPKTLALVPCKPDVKVAGDFEDNERYYYVDPVTGQRMEFPTLSLDPKLCCAGEFGNGLDLFWGIDLRFIATWLFP